MRSPRRLDFDTHTSFLIVALANKISSSATRLYTKQFGIGVMEWRVLTMIAAHPRASTKQISEVTGVDKGPVSRAVSLLIKQGYLVATEDSSDSRRSLHILTKAGYELNNRVFLASQARRRLLLTGFSRAEQEKLATYLRRLMANIPLVAAYKPRR